MSDPKQDTFTLTVTREELYILAALVGRTTSAEQTKANDQRFNIYMGGALMGMTRAELDDLKERLLNGDPLMVTLYQALDEALQEHMRSTSTGDNAGR